MFFIYFKQHLQKALFDKIKTDFRNWIFMAEKPVSQGIFNFFQNMTIYEYQSLIQRSRRVTKIFKNMQTRSSKVEKIREIIKSAVFLSFSGF